MKNIEEFYNYSRKNIFFTGSEYVDYIENKEEKDRKWYETFYLWYYNNGIYLILIVGLILIILMCFDKYCKNNCYNDKKKIKTIQTGGNENADMSELQNVKQEALAENAEKKEEKESKKGEGQGKSKWLYKKGIRKKAYNMGKLSDEKARKLKLRAERFKKGFKAGLGPLYKILFGAFIVFAFGAFIMPTIIMFFISAITFFITKSQIQKILTK
tara:strand:- start:12 stop:653 length:642 start_codon:yes stop_codon:yes gene_type:complete